MEVILEKNPFICEIIEDEPPERVNVKGSSSKYIQKRKKKSIRSRKILYTNSYLQRAYQKIKWTNV